MVSVSETSVMPIAAMSSGTTSPALVHGMVGAGTPCGSAPTVATPSSASPRAAETTVAPTTATRIAGSRLVTRGSTSITASTATPTSSVVVSVWSTFSANCLTSSRKLSALVEKPNSFGSWPTMIVMPRPVMYPTCTSLESRSATKPSFPSPRQISSSPTITASIPARAIAVPGSPPATSSGVIAARISGEIDESGPSTNTREGPNSAYPTRHAIVVYRPVAGGSPASSA